MHQFGSVETKPGLQLFIGHGSPAEIVEKLFSDSAFLHVAVKFCRLPRF